MFKLPFVEKISARTRLPDADSVEIKHAGVLHLDIVGYTRLVQENLTLAHRQIRHLYRRICRLCQTYNGIARELRGDAAVVEFESATDALRAAFSIHAAHALMDATRLGRINPEIRTGLSYGEVISDSNMITGEAVIRAQRIEQLAQPGEVLIDECLHDAIGVEHDFDIRLWGSRRLKGFEFDTAIYEASRNNYLSVDDMSRQFESMIMNCAV